MRRIDFIVVHHTATPNTYSTHQIRAMHLAREFNDIGYHAVIERDGSIHAGRPIAKIGAHVRGKNRHSVGVAVIGDNTVSGREWTIAQKISLKVFLQALKLFFPDAQIVGHRDLKETLCPGRDIVDFLPSGRG